MSFVRTLDPPLRRTTGCTGPVAANAVSPLQAALAGATALPPKLAPWPFPPQQLGDC